MGLMGLMSERLLMHVLSMKRLMTGGRPPSEWGEPETRESRPRRLNLEPFTLYLLLSEEDLLAEINRRRAASGRPAVR